jgi:hypothetical protein
LSQPVIVADHPAEVRSCLRRTGAGRRAHKWLTDKRLEDYRAREERGFELYISKLAEEKIRNHAMEHVERAQGGHGPPAGGMYRYNDLEYTLVRDVVTTGP